MRRTVISNQRRSVSERFGLQALSVLLGVLSFTNGCRHLGTYHEVRSGETLWRISTTYDVDLMRLAKLNGIKNAEDLKAGGHLFIPGRLKTRRVSIAKDNVERDLPAPREVKASYGRFSWPVAGKIESEFGWREGRRHEGIDIAATEGAPIMAADSGKVIFAGQRGDYGNLVILLHHDGLATVYAHNRENLVKEGDAVRYGQMIARVGRTGNATGTHVHFEVRQGKLPRNPLQFLDLKH